MQFVLLLLDANDLYALLFYSMGRFGDLSCAEIDLHIELADLGIHLLDFIVESA